MEVRATTEPPLQTGADTVCVGIVEGEGVAHDVADGALGALVESGEASARPRKVAVAHAEGVRWLLVGLGARDGLDAECARVAAAVAEGRARDLGARVLCWEVPHHVDDAFAAGLVEGTLLSAYRFDRFKSDPGDDDRGAESLVLSAHHDVSTPVDAAAVVATAQNAARDLQNTPSNELTPTRLGERARELADDVEGLTVEVDGRDAIVDRAMGAFAAVARGSDEEPALITMRYAPAADATGPVLGLVGKAVTFDTGGISIKPSAKMEEMKFDMSGGAAVLEAVGAIARLGLPVRVVAVIGATENMPSGHAVKPGDIVRARNGTTIEVNNTDAEGRLVLSDCLAWAVEQGAERLVDLATLTGAIVVALGSTHAGLFSNDDAWAGEVEAAAGASGELVWRLPLHAEYAEMIKGRYADIVNTTEARKASSITAAEFLKRFVGDVPWAHVDIAGTAWNLDRPYARKGGAGFGVRLLVDLARRAAAGA
ncbi:MAG TPA: leucyl aminopeptidase [Solirubrobacteraceae bacterium]|nr:leucyl aminopeptidase [Solirubrobacteraceae bacterium]